MSTTSRRRVRTFFSLHHQPRGAYESNLPGELSTTFHLRARGAAIQGVNNAWVSCASSARRRGWERGSGEAVQAAPGRPRTPFATLNRRGAARLRGVARPPGAGTGVCSTHGRHRILAGTASGASGEHVYRSEALFLRSSGSLRLELKTRKKNVRTASADPFTRARTHGDAGTVRGVSRGFDGAICEWTDGGRSLPGASGEIPARERG